MELNKLGRTILTDRYARRKLTHKPHVGGTVLFRDETGNKQVATVLDVDSTTKSATVQLLDEDTTYNILWTYLDILEESTPEEVFARVSTVIASVENAEDRERFAKLFFDEMDAGRFIPGGRILAGAGVDGLTLYNCYVIPSPKDSRGGIFDTLATMSEIMARGGGVGINISTLRPRNSHVAGVSGRSSGAVSWGALYSTVTGLIEQGGSRRGALMLVMHDWHPDLFEFIQSKKKAGYITNANISVLLSDKFMRAVENNDMWTFRFPDTSFDKYNEVWDGDLDKWIASGYPFIEYSTVRAVDVWNIIIESAWASAEPGVIFIDNVNNESDAWYMYNMACTNPCAEKPLPPWGVCDLGSVNLSKFVDDGDVNWDGLRKTIECGVRFLDNVIDVTPYIFPENEERQKGERRIGLNTMGLAEMMIRLGITYGSPKSLEFIDTLYTFIRDVAFETSVRLASEKGAFPLYDDRFLMGGYATRLPDYLRKMILDHGIRNVNLLTQAPTGTIGTMMNTSTGIEPYFMFEYYRQTRLGTHLEVVPVAQEWMRAHPGEPLPEWFVTAMDLEPVEHIAVQARIQGYIDSAISKTANMPNEYTVRDTADLYRAAYKLGCKSVTVYRDGSRSEQVLRATVKAEEAKHDLQSAENAVMDHICPDCSAEMVVQDGCSTCPECGYSKCAI